MSSSPMKYSFAANNNAMNGKQFRIMKLSGNRTVTPAAAASDLVIGVLNNAPYAQAGAACEVVMVGPCKCVIGANSTNGTFLVADANGAAVPVTLGTTTTNVAVGRAVADYTANDVQEIWVQPGFIQV